MPARPTRTPARNAVSPRLAAVCAVVVGAWAATLPGNAAIETASQRDAPRGWSAMTGIDTPGVIELARSLPVAAQALEDQPYCAPDAEIASALGHDFDERLIHTTPKGGAQTQLWASEGFGTWTVVMNRDDATSCIVASGIGYQPDQAPEVFYKQVGLTG